ncbi:unnamed protein product [Mytilus coruscus]|uniref:Uncharacterized protein n=1 Tax=Mytilus coruscus TaxID=42192 RepID=A0A6J8CN27_MYTCO|nr:unnamed protein product [Mytilus coruscus]
MTWKSAIIGNGYDEDEAVRISAKTNTLPLLWDTSVILHLIPAIYRPLVSAIVERKETTVGIYEKTKTRAAVYSKGPNICSPTYLVSVGSKDSSGT